MKLSVTMLAPTSLAGRRLVVVMPVVHERAEGLQAFQTTVPPRAASPLRSKQWLRCSCSASVKNTSNFVTTSRIRSTGTCASCGSAIPPARRPRASGADLQPPSYGALQSLSGEWLAYSISYFHARRAIPESHDSSLRRIISRCHAIVVKKKVDAQRVDNSYRLSIHFFTPLFNWSGVCAQRPFTGTTFDFGAMLLFSDDSR